MAKTVRKSRSKEVTPISEGAKLVDQYFDSVGEAYLRHAPDVDMNKIRDWRPKLWSLTRLNPWYGGLVGVHRKRTGVGKDKLVWLEIGLESNPTLLLLHGFAAAKEHWLPLLPFFGGQYRILIPDLPGWGESGFDPDKHYGLEEQTERLHAWLMEIGANKVNVVGNSMGGALAGLLAARYPQHITSLVLMDALGLPGKVHTGFIDEVLRGKNRLVPRDPVDVIRLTDLVFHNRALAASAAFFSASELIHRRDVNTFLFREMLSRRPDYHKATFENIAAPTLVMWGTEDDVLHVSCAHEFERLIKRSEVCLFDGVGHLPMIETPYLCAQAIKEFIRKST
ncbi:MAG TPA: alpha/beta hydrolase [Limnobacter sp.]|nr:alpha/beta hydrolase [Limnobacter sp.]